MLRRRELAEHRAALDWRLRTGRLVPLLPGTYALAEQAREPAVRLRAVCAAHPDAVLVEAVDLALRTRSATLAGMHEALRLTRNRAGNAERAARVLLDSRDEPWSEAERRAHRLLRAAGITGWRGNLPVHVAGHTSYPDIGLRRCRLAVEIDGRLHEDDASLLESDRWRQNALVRAGWRVLRFTWAMLRDHPRSSCRKSAPPWVCRRRGSPDGSEAVLASLRLPIQGRPAGLCQ